MANPKLPAHKRVKTTGISLPEPLTKQAKKYASMQGRSFSNLVRELLLKELNLASK